MHIFQCTRLCSVLRKRSVPGSIGRHWRTPFLVYMRTTSPLSSATRRVATRLSSSIGNHSLNLHLRSWSEPVSTCLLAVLLIYICAIGWCKFRIKMLFLIVTKDSVFEPSVYLVLVLVPRRCQCSQWCCSTHSVISARRGKPSPRCVPSLFQTLLSL